MFPLDSEPMAGFFRPAHHESIRWHPWIRKSPETVEAITDRYSSLRTNEYWAIQRHSNDDGE